jgi:2-polyprenyl-3-methyl-5-hydroxy-6-metoxy-1,4-benzoquinol methylase
LLGYIRKKGAVAVLSAEDVALLYRSILGREPESPAAISSWMDSGYSLEQAIKALLGSKEYKSNREFPVGDFFVAEKQHVETNPPFDKLEALFDRVRKQWGVLGESEPHWSVLTDDKFKPVNIQETVEDFYETGEATAVMIDQFSARADRGPPSGTCLELGCGVGRVTQYLARRFDRVIAVDVSPGNLAVAERHLFQQAIGNVELVQLTSITDLDTLAGFDFFFSTIVLQHNPPPVQKVILDKLFSKVNRGGGCLFQIPTELPNYSFRLDEYLSSPVPVMEMHALPMREVLSLLQRHKIPVLEVRPDPMTGVFGSFTFFAAPKSV